MAYMTPIDAYRQSENFKAERQSNALANMLREAQVRQAQQQMQNESALRGVLSQVPSDGNIDYGGLGRKLLPLKPETGFALIKMDEDQRVRQDAAKRLSALGGGQVEGQKTGGGVFDAWMQHPNPGIRAMAKQGALLAQSGGFKDVADLNSYVQKMGEFDARFNDAQSSRQERMQAQKDLAQMNFDLRRSLAQEQMDLRKTLSQQDKWVYDATRGLAINTTTGEARPITQAGTPIGPKLTGGGAATEDERKAASWLAQATNAYNNMAKVVTETPEAVGPGMLETAASAANLEGAANFLRSPARQQFVQAASSFSEAALRAATGAGINKDEARQKIQELTPQYTDSEPVRVQKLESMKVYLNSLAARAGRADTGFIPGRSNIPTGSPKTFKVPPDPRLYEGGTLTNPATGEKLLARGGQWVRVK